MLRPRGESPGGLSAPPKGGERRNVRNPFYLCFEKGFVVASISKVDYKSVSEPYMIVLVRANAAKAKCKAETYAYQRSLM